MGIDDWSMRKRFRYATVMVDLLTNNIIDINYGRKAEDVAAWLKKFPNLRIIVRDGADFFRKAINLSHPDAIQISDRFHYIATVTSHFYQAILNILPTHIKLNNKTVATIDHSSFGIHKTNTAAGRRHDQLVKEVNQASNDGLNHTEIARKFQLSRRTVAKYLSGHARRKPSPTTNAFKLYIDDVLSMHKSGKGNRKIYDEICAKGYQRSYSTFAKYVRILYRSSMTTVDTQISSRKIAKLLYYRHGSCDYAPITKHVMTYYPAVKKILTIFLDFVDISKGRSPEKLDEWLIDVKNSNDKELDKAYREVKKNQKAILNSIRFPRLTNGPIEGVNNKIKAVKRMVFGRCIFVNFRKRILLLDRSVA